MAVMARETWTDERLDDLAKRMDKGFDEAKVEVRDLRADMDKGFDEVKGEIRDLRAEVNIRSTSLEARFDSMQQTMVAGFISLFVGIAACVIAGLLGAIALT